MWSFCLGRIFLLITISPCPGRDFISFQTRKETKQRNAFKPRIPKCRRCYISGLWPERSTAPATTTRSRTPTSHSNGTHTLRLQRPRNQVPSAKCQVPSAKCQVPSAKKPRSQEAKKPNAQRPTPNAQRPTPNAQRPTPNAQVRRYCNFGAWCSRWIVDSFDSGAWFSVRPCVSYIKLVFLRRWGRSVCVPLELGVGVQLRVDGWGLCYVRAKNLK